MISLKKINYPLLSKILILLLAIIFLRFSACINTHLFNFSPLDALAIFSGAILANPLLRLVAPALIAFTSDIFINFIYQSHLSLFYAGCYWQYIAYFVIAFVASFYAKKFKFSVLPLYAGFSSLIFFVISNFGVWFSTLLYPHTLNGLFECYVAAIPFYKNTLLSDIFYTVIFFYSYYSIRKTSFFLPNTKQNSGLVN